MAISAAGIIFSSLNDNTLSRLTSDRTVSAIPFACRYRLVDFCLSNLVNANISNINIVANYNYRSLMDHIGSGKDWDLARRSGGINLISPYKTAKSATAKMFSTRMEALINIQDYINEIKEDYVVLMDSDNVLNISITDVLETHAASGAAMTLVTHRINSEYTSKHDRMMISADNGVIKDISMGSKYLESNPYLCLNIFVMSTLYLRKLIEEASAYKESSLTTLIFKNYKTSLYKTYEYGGYVASVSSFLDYYKCSMELAKNSNARLSLLQKKDNPIFTRVHNSAPVTYLNNAKIKNSMIADGCVIDGTVENCVIFRNVRIERGAVVKNSVLFSGTVISKNASLNAIVTDKDVYVTEGVNLSGHDNMPFYIQKGRKV